MEQTGPTAAEFLNASLISINTTSAGVANADEPNQGEADLTFEVVERTSRLQLFGAVGPNMGRMTVHLTPQPLDREVDNSDVEIPIADLSAPGNRTDNVYVYEIDTYRPVDALGQLLLGIPLDARVRYTVTIRPDLTNGTNEGGAEGDGNGTTRIALHGATFATYTNEEDEWYEDDWLADQNQELAYRQGWEDRPSEPLNGGKIAGIVVSLYELPRIATVGSVALQAGYSALVGGIWVCKQTATRQCTRREICPGTCAGRDTRYSTERAQSDKLRSEA